MKLLLVATALLATAAQAVASEALSEYEVKAAFIYNFAKFTEWPGSPPEQSKGPMTICIAGGRSLGKAVESIEGKQAKGRGIQCRTIYHADDVGDCEILFVTGNQERSRSKMMAASNGKAILTISELEENGTQSEKGIINFVVIDNKVRFEIDQKAARRQGLVFSSHVLKLAYRLIE